MRLLAGRKRRQAQNYDERQMAARGVAYRLAYMTLVGALMADVLVQRPCNGAVDGAGR